MRISLYTQRVAVGALWRHGRFFLAMASAVRLGLPVLVGAFSIGCTEEVATLPPLRGDAVVVAFGDSLTYGSGAAPEASYPAQLERLIGHRVINAGVPGELAEEGERRLRESLGETQPALLLLCHGGNNLLRRRDGATAVEPLRSMIMAARSRGVDVVLIAVPQPGLWLEPSEFYEALGTEFGIPVEREALTDILSDSSLKADAIHPNAAGYRKLAEAIARLLRQAGAVE